MDRIIGGRRALIMAIVLALCSCDGSPLSEDASITGLHFTTTSAFPDNPPPTNVDVTLSDPAPARAIYRATLALPSFPPGGILRCPADLGYGHTISFMQGSTVATVATLSSGGCHDATIFGAPPVRQTTEAYWALVAESLGVEVSTLFSFPTQ